MTAAVQMNTNIITRAIRVESKPRDLEQLRLSCADVLLKADPFATVVEIVSAGVNPSDVKAVLGGMPYAVWPRTPGRDYAGIVRQGPVELVGKEVWGSGGELGIRRDGTHAQHLVIDPAHVREKPSTVSLREAGALGVPFVTAYQGLMEAGGVERGDVVLVLGGNGKVGQAVIQLATMCGARVFAVERTREKFLGHASAPVDMIDASAVDIATYVRDKTNGHGADIVYNIVGSPYFEAACKAMAQGARQIFISTIARAVPFDIFAFYRGRHKFLGIDTLALDSRDCAEILSTLKPGFERGTLRAFPVSENAVFSLAQAEQAYRAVIGGSRERIVLAPSAA
jgi:NADPH:quinone reductase-like Zn-dependent oxidoreductase